MNKKRIPDVQQREEPKMTEPKTVAIPEQLDPNKLISIIDEFFEKLMQGVPCDYRAEIELFNDCPWMVSLVFPCKKVFRGKLPPMEPKGTMPSDLGSEGKS